MSLASEFNPPPASSEIRMALHPEPAPLKVFVVDDQPHFRELLQQVVEDLGYECRTARDGLEAWEMLQVEHADIVLSDWRMPRMDGADLCRNVRSLDGVSHYTYFVLLTSFADKTHFLRAMEAGADGCYSKCIDPEEIRGHLVSAHRIVAMHRRLSAEKSALERDSQKAFRVARTDALTAIANRLRMDEDLAAAWSSARRYGRPCSMAICDIDEFKKYNDHFGHLAGDDVLRRVAQAIRQSVRRVDGVYRYGGEEFLVLLPEQSLTQATRAMDRLREAIEQMALLSASNRRVVTISVGVAEFDLARDASSEAWLGRADAALYRAKVSGRNRVEVDDPSRDSSSSDSA